MGKQSARIMFCNPDVYDKDGNIIEQSDGILRDHKEIFFEGHYHDELWMQNKLLWKKLRDIGPYYQVIGAGVSNNKLFLRLREWTKEDDEFVATGKALLVTCSDPESQKYFNIWNDTASSIISNSQNQYFEQKIHFHYDQTFTKKIVKELPTENISKTTCYCVETGSYYTMYINPTGEKWIDKGITYSASGTISSESEKDHTFLLFAFSALPSIYDDNFINVNIISTENKNMPESLMWNLSEYSPSYYRNAYIGTNARWTVDDIHNYASNQDDTIGPIGLVGTADTVIKLVKYDDGDLDNISLIPTRKLGISMIQKKTQFTSSVTEIKTKLINLDKYKGIPIDKTWYYPTPPIASYSPRFKMGEAYYIFHDIKWGVFDNRVKPHCENWEYWLIDYNCDALANIPIGVMIDNKFASGEIVYFNLQEMLMHEEGFSAFRDLIQKEWMNDAESQSYVYRCGYEMTICNTSSNNNFQHLKAGIFMYIPLRFRVYYRQGYHRQSGQDRQWFDTESDFLNCYGVMKISANGQCEYVRTHNQISRLMYIGDKFVIYGNWMSIDDVHVRGRNCVWVGNSIDIINQDPAVVGLIAEDFTADSTYVTSIVFYRQKIRIFYSGNETPVSWMCSINPNTKEYEITNMFDLYRDPEDAK